MTVAGIVLIVIGVVACVVTKGVQWHVALVMLAAGVFISNGPLGQMIVTLCNSLGQAIISVVQGFG
jgi:hypothetical protein